MYYVYVLLSERDDLFYTGFTKDLTKRLEQHNAGAVNSTKKRTPFKLVYYEASNHINDAIHRENYLKSTYGKRYIRNRLKNDLVH